MIEVSHLTKRYGEIAAVSDISFSVKKGEIVGLLGPNGAGKSTTMRILTGFLPATGGSARVAGFDMAKQSLQARRLIGYMPENTPLYLNMTVIKYLRFMAALKGVPARERAAAVDRAMESTAATDVAGRLIRNLSKGYRQRVGLAQAIVADPQILILDEPTIGLDPTQIIEIRHLISAMANERTVILSSHILHEVSEICERVMIMHRGEIIADERTGELSKRLQHGQTIDLAARGDAGAIEKLLRGHPRIKKVQRLKSEAPGGAPRFRIEAGEEADLMPDLARALVGAGVDVLHLGEHRLSLEEIFINLVRDQGEREVA
ncbi:ABC transporter ATP-binding protein [Candidatus Sumerlaeota bacterium]|nr:ABC transporter ATP-binding protein [Candidatus Sumerlaeota bacterium]